MMPAALTALRRTEGHVTVGLRHALAADPRPVLAGAGNGLPEAIDMRFREVLVAVDFSPASVAAARAALGLVHADGGRLTLVHVMDPWPRRTSRISSTEALARLHEYEARAASASERLMGLLPPGRDGRCIRPLVVSGAPHDMILRAAREAKADLVVLGVPVDASADPPRLGPTVRAVLRGAHCPVLLVPEPRRRSESRHHGLNGDWDTQPGHPLAWSPGGGRGQLNASQ
jgi:nucleotide-binding universal stress UspA family protein